MAGWIVAAAAVAQSEARQATPEEVDSLGKGPAATALSEVASPMLLEVSLAATDERRALWQLEPGLSFVARETRDFVCDQARVTHLMVTRGKEKRGRVPLTISPSLTSGWYRQDIDLTVVLETGDGKVLGKRTWDDLTIGNAGGPYAGRPKSPELELSLPQETWEREFADGKSPKVRILVEIQGEEDD
jgi:hypothetical protein